MEKSIFEQMGGTYHQEGNYLLPDVAVPESVSIGVWGQRHLRYIREYRKALYLSLQLSGELNGYLAGIDQQAEDMFFQLVAQMAQCQDVTEQLKASDQMEWTGRMNNIKTNAIEVINAELIYT